MEKVMADLQKYFDSFHEKIRLDDENEILREKREIVLDKLRDRLQGMFEEEEETLPTFEPFNRGSYAMGTGVVPVDADYDIDVGLRFDLHKDDFPDPVVVKAWVYNALAGHTDDVTIMQPCVRVQYHLKGEPCYHVDVAVYAHDGNPKSLHLARGKPHSKQEYRIWQPADPIGLIEAIRTRYDNEDDRSQFRRVIRYLKRWKDVQFPSDGNAAPIGIGITVAAYYWFAPSRQMVDAFQNKYKYNDLSALRQFVGRLLGQFSSTYHDGEQAERLQAFLPVRPYNDLFEKMTNLQMANLRAKFSSLRETLEAVEDQEVDPVDACKKLQSHFGADFLVPEPAKTAERRAPAIVSSSSSA